MSSENANMSSLLIMRIWTDLGDKVFKEFLQVFEDLTNFRITPDEYKKICSVIIPRTHLPLVAKLVEIVISEVHFSLFREKMEGFPYKNRTPFYLHARGEYMSVRSLLPYEKVKEQNPRPLHKDNGNPPSFAAIPKATTPRLKKQKRFFNPLSIPTSIHSPIVLDDLSDDDANNARNNANNNARNNVSVTQQLRNKHNHIHNNNNNNNNNNKATTRPPPATPTKIRNAASINNLIHSSPSSINNIIDHDVQDFIYNNNNNNNGGTLNNSGALNSITNNMKPTNISTINYSHITNIIN